MSPIAPHRKSASAPDIQVDIDRSSNPEHPPPLQSASRRSSNQTIKQALMARSRANSMAGLRRSSRAGSRLSGGVLGQDGQSGVALPMGDIDWSQWDMFDPNGFLQYDEFLQAPPHIAHEDGHAGQVPQTSDSQQQQYQAPLVSSFDNTGVIDPALLEQQPMGTSALDPNMMATPGLTAVPGINDFMPTQPMQYQPYPVYPDPTIMYQPQPLPYFYSQGYAHPGYTPIGQQLMQPTQQPIQPLPSPQKSKKRVQPDSDSDSEDEVPMPKRQRIIRSPKDESEDESDDYKVNNSARARKSEQSRRVSRDSGFSSSSSLGKPKQLTVARIGQRPQKCEDKPWVRINNNTKGETTRTARINGEANELRKYKSKPLPHGDWNSRKYEFEYSNHGGIDEFKKKKMPARQIFEYITQYPSDQLRLWIQVSPADMARRYGSPGHSKCLFENCPKQVWGDSGTIDVGHYRVAFDEKFKTYGNKVVDPFDCPGFVHLYCLERFCNFESICQVADVQVDTRVDLPREAGQAKWTMSGRPELELAQYFLKACKKQMLRNNDAFREYPIHTSSSAPKQFDRTLVHALNEVNVANRTRSQMRQFVERKLTPNVLMINKGDMEIAMTQKKIKASKVYKKALKSKRATAATFNFEAFYDEYDPVINERIARYRALKEQYEAEDAAGLSRRKGKGRAVNKRKRTIRDDDDSDSEPDLDSDESDTEELGVYPTQQSQATRSSPRKRPRPSYSDEANTTPSTLRVLQFPNCTHRLPTIPESPPNPYLDQGYVAAQAEARKASLSALFPKDYTFDLDDLTQDTNGEANDAPLAPGEFDAFMLKYLQRRKSSTLSHAHATMGKVPSASASPRSPEFRRVVAKGKGRQASFLEQPVSEMRGFGKDDPPSKLVGTAALAPARRSSRLASKGPGKE
ncbi:hypothetical protein FB567DRAFT_501335 [Paraphoma chrysanthemicola]|uniref:Uncharacterized protein n=1 Tax=Paraphoma chrysanthemicola TaxID=798071 RepID=A0A8K0R2Y5_9PLEO|nr:hypothetical protein FB567DRAFT_501335 [Paraphoma chrysanthemicola]